MKKLIIAYIIFQFFLIGIYWVFNSNDLELTTSVQQIYPTNIVVSFISRFDEGKNQPLIREKIELPTSIKAEDSKFGLTKTLKITTHTTRVYFHTYQESNLAFGKKLLLINKGPPIFYQFII